MNNSNYVEWLKKQGVPLFEGGGIYWRLYQGVLVPAPATPCFIEIDSKEARALIKESGALFLRYESEPCEKETEWWIITCDSYNPEKLSSKIRNMIKRGNRNCSVQPIEAVWLAEHGYECYFAAFSRYKNARPVAKNIFQDSLFKTLDGPFEYWGVFVQDHLSGYCQCVIESNEVSTNIIKHHPEYLKYYTSYALISSLVNHYVAKNAMILSNSARSILHDTNMQDFLLKLGFRKQFCHLNIVYKTWLKILVQGLYPMHRLMKKLPVTNHIYKLQALLFQEELRRACSVR